MSISRVRRRGAACSTAVRITGGGMVCKEEKHGLSAMCGTGVLPILAAALMATATVARLGVETIPADGAGAMVSNYGGAFMTYRYAARQDPRIGAHARFLSNISLDCVTRSGEKRYVCRENVAIPSHGQWRKASVTCVLDETGTGWVMRSLDVQ